MKMLHLPLKAKWYEMIESGIKTEEYREIKPYWSKRFTGMFKPLFSFRCNYRQSNVKGYTHVKFSFGYTKRTMTYEIESITIGKGKREWGAPEENVFIIKLGKEIMNEYKDKTCKKCAHRIMSDSGYPIYYCNITGKKARGNDPSCDDFENTEQEDKNERLRKIATRLEQLEKEYAEKKIDLESFIRQRSILIGKKERLEASKGKENYSFIKTIKI